MPRKFHILVALLTVYLPLFGQYGLVVPTEPELILHPGTHGQNGAAVAYNPVDSVWYSVFAGNTTYNLDSYGFEGHILNKVSAGYDFRGLWWNEKDKALQGNGYDDNGWWEIALSPVGLANGHGHVLWMGSTHQPGSQSVGAYDPRKKQIAFFHDGRIFTYHARKGRLRKIYGLRDCPVSPNKFNGTSILCIGHKKLRFALLQPDRRRLLFFDRKGRFIQSHPLPAGAPAPENFGISYAGGLLFLYDSETRQWLGYRIFDASAEK